MEAVTRALHGRWSLHAPGGVLAARLTVAATPLRRMRGLLWRPVLRPGEALLLHPCSQVHTFGMRYVIDAVFCDAQLRVVAVHTLPPWRLSRTYRQARCCIEAPAGSASAAAVVEGCRLDLVEESG
ncbi:MAG TPA: DUF192 domain-containing protein [Actinomycetota bacterium]|nr:DUF192 domain-containing protein [Actinomycetota bacterium]